MNKAEKAVEQAKLRRERAVLKELEAHYEYALQGINERLQVLQAAPETQSNVYRISYQKVMRQQVSAILENLRANTYTTLDQYMHDAYTTGYVGAMYSLHNQDVPLLIPINQDAVLKAVQHDTKLKEPLYASLGIDTAQMKKDINRELSRGLASGLTYDEIARNIKQTTKAPLARAKTIARTEGHRIHEQSSQDAAVAAKAEGADLVKQWDATLDGDTRPNHRQLDGQIRELEEPFEVGSFKPMHPGGFGKASEDCNCRCVSLHRARWALDEEELAELKKRAETFGLDKSDEFADFEREYLKVAEEEPEKKEPEASVFVPAATIEEAEKTISEFYNDKQFGALGVSYKGVSLEVANEVNGALVPLYREFDVDLMGGIVAPAGNTKLGQQISGAIAGYSPVRNSFILNRKSLKNLKTAQAAFDGENAVLMDLLEHPERYDFTKLSRSTVGIIERSKVSGRATVPRSITESLQHEFGHALQRKVKASDLWTDAKKNMPEYADRISGYAGESDNEYIAESFVSYRKGEGIADPVLVQIFESLRRK